MDAKNTFSQFNVTPEMYWFINESLGNPRGWQEAVQRKGAESFARVCYDNPDAIISSSNQQSPLSDWLLRWNGSSLDRNFTDLGLQDRLSNAKTLFFYSSSGRPRPWTACHLRFEMPGAASTVIRGIRDLCEVPQFPKYY